MYGWAGEPPPIGGQPHPLARGTNKGGGVIKQDRQTGYNGIADAKHKGMSTANRAKRAFQGSFSPITATAAPIAILI